MHKSILITLALMLILVGLGAVHAEKENNVQVLVDSEHAFAQRANDQNTKSAFLAFLADDAVIFQPGLLPGKQTYEKREANNSLLSWNPAFADIAASGELGFTTGPWEYRKDKGDKQAVVHGNYVSLWRKQSDGQWKVIIDLGISNPPPTTPIIKVDHPNNLAKLAKSSATIEQAKLLETDEANGKKPNIHSEVLLALLADDARVLRNDHAPFIGKKAIKDYLLAKPENANWQPIKAEVAQSYDFGYSYGTLSIVGSDGAQKGYYVRFWRKQKDGQWKIVLDITSMLPPEKS